MSGPTSIITMKDVARRFQVGGETVRALRGVSFNIERGEFVAIMGASGSGKSTLLNVMGCLDTVSEGDYFLDGTSVKNMKRNQLALMRNRKIGFVFQSYNLLPRTTALENVELPLFYNPVISKAQRLERAEKALDAVGLTDRMMHTPGQLSGGQQQRIAIARSLVNDPVVILADEATGNLDTRTSYEIMALFQALNNEGKTVAFVTHEPDIVTFCKRIIVLRDGKVIEDRKNDTQASARDALAALPRENGNNGGAL